MQSIGDIALRAYHNVLANWPLMLIRLAEGVVLLAIAVAGVIVAAVPIISKGLHEGWGAQSDPGEILRSFLFEYAWILVFWFVLACVIVVVMAMIHSFIHAGVVAGYLEAEANAPPLGAGTTAEFRRFLPERWFRDARAHWWRVFWIYNIIWGLFAMILLLPILALTVVVLLAKERPEILVMGCLGLVVFMIVIIFGSIVIHVWSQVAILAGVAGNLTAREATRTGWRVVLRRPVEVLVITGLLFVLSLSVGGVFAIFNFGSGLTSSIRSLEFFMLPLNIGVALVQSAFSVFVSSWFIAALATVVVSDRRLIQAPATQSTPQS